MRGLIAKCGLWLVLLVVLAAFGQARQDATGAIPAASATTRPAA